MNNYYNELSQLELLKQELDKFADSLENNKEGCFKHRIEAFINILLNETKNQNYLRNKIQNYINEANYRGDVKSYVMQVFLSFFEPIEFNIPKSLINVVNKNKRVDSSMIEGYNNFKSANNYTQSQEPHKEALPPQQPEKPKPELKIDQIALKYAYEGLQITRKNGNEIAEEYGHNSGEKLFQRFTYYSSSANRKGKPTPCTPKKLDNKIKLIESIIELLPTDKQGRAKDEVSILKKIYDAEY